MKPPRANSVNVSDRMSLTEVAGGLELFRGIDADGVEDALFRLNAVKRTYQKGEIVVHAGLEATRLVAVASGHLHVYCAVDSDHPVLVREIGAGEVLGLWILHVPEVKCWPGTVVAATDSVVVSLDMERARRLVASADPVYARLTANSSRIISRELFSTWRQLMVMDAPTIEARVKAYLDELDSESGHTGEVEVPFDREQMSEYLGVTRPSLSRALGHLRDQGLNTWRKNVFRLKCAQST